jgi:hypothetical protein
VFPDVKTGFHLEDERMKRLAPMAAALTLLTIGLAAQPHAEVEDLTAIVACIGKDGVFRIGSIEQPCKEGERRYLLSPAKPEMEEPKVVNSEEPQPTKSPSEARIRTLEQQVEQLERELLRSRELAGKLPFVLADKSGKPALTVTETSGGPVLEMHAGGRPIVQVGIGPRGNPGVRVWSPQGAPRAAMGMSPEGIGAIAVYNDGGRAVATLLGNSDKGPILGVGSGEGTQFLAALRVGSNGGVIELADKSGGVKAEGGVLDTGAGVFRVKGETFNYIAGQKMRLPAW